MRDLYSVAVFVDTRIRLIRNLSLNVGSSYVLVRDQFNLPMRAASDEDILLGRIALPTSWRYFTYWRLTYRFGSRYANIVNPRL
jgi:hypothetical protein